MNASDNRQTRVLKNKEAVAEFAVDSWIELATVSVAENGRFAVALLRRQDPYRFLPEARHLSPSIAMGQDPYFFGGRALCTT